MKVPPTDRRHFEQLEKIASQRGTLTETLRRVYQMNCAIAIRREKAAVASAAQERRFAN
ncbi:hypothetical protein ABIE27_000340 [Paenibacillus sp. 4624]|uniref:hypothetical protein n=1 Tax=Paenibacillus sp. 4624 TaxID=3156453 RepID=UPI003D2348C4